MEKRKRGRPPKLAQQVMIEEKPVKVEENVKMAVATESKIKHIIRAISKTGMPMGAAEPLPQVEAYISQYLEAGYKLNYVVMIGQDPEMINMLYVLTKE